MHKLRFTFSTGEENSLKKLSKALSMCESIMDILFKNKCLDVHIVFWQGQDWRVAQTMLTIYDLVNLSISSEIKNTIKNGKLSTVDVVVRIKKYDFNKIKELLYLVLSAELGIYDHLDASIEFSYKDSIVFFPYDDRGANVSVKSKSMYSKIIDLYE